MIVSSMAFPWTMVEQGVSHCSREKWSGTTASGDAAPIEIQAWIFKTSVPPTNECPEPMDIEENMSDG